LLAALLASRSPLPAAVSVAPRPGHHGDAVDTATEGIAANKFAG
jgi:hypothetical protein